MGVARLKKLREKSIRELSVRGSQEIRKLGERALGLSVGEMSDGAFLHHIKRGQRSDSAEETALYIVNRIAASVASSSFSSHRSFFPSLGYRREIIATMERDYGSERQAIIERAGRAVEGRFDLLGLRDVSFGDPPDWLLEPLSGRRSRLDHWSRISYLDPSLVGDKKITWELNRHQHFVTLGQAYWMTGDERYAEAFASQAASWMDQNPPNCGINWSSSLELAFRVISWLWALHLFAGSSRITSRLASRLLKHLMAHGHHIESYLSYYFSPNTHLTGEALGLFYLGTALPELRRADIWRKTGFEILIDELSRQLRSDGVYFEQSTYYHRYTADFYIHLLALARAGSVELPVKVEERLGQLITHLMWITRPDGSSPLIGDDDGGKLIAFGSRSPDDFRDTVATATALFGRGDWKYVAGDAAVETLWLLGPEAIANYESIQSEEPRQSSHVFEAGGYSVMRDGWSKGSTYTLIDSGPHGSLSCGHAHADALSIEFAAAGRAWIIDPGTFTYAADSGMRDRFRISSSHNTVTVDGMSQSIPSGPFSWSHVAQSSLDEFIIGEGFDYLKGSHDGYRRLIDPVEHTRAVVCPKASAQGEEFAQIPSYLIVRDGLIASGHHDYSIRYHLAPGCSAFADGNRVIVAEPGGARLNIAVFGESTVRARISEGFVSRAYGQREPSLVAVFAARGEGPQEFTSIIAAATSNQSIRVERHGVSHSGAQGFEIVSGKLRDLVIVSDSARLIECGPLTADGTVACARFENDAFVRAFMIHGQRLETGEGFSFRSTAPVNHCAIRRTEDGIEGSVNGGNSFYLALGEQARKVVINRTTYEPGRQLAVFAGDGLKWELINAS